MNTKKYLSLLITIFSALMFGSVEAGKVTVPHKFTAGTAAVANEVNTNFDSVKTAVDDNYRRLPLIWADSDKDNGGTTLTASGQISLNKIKISVPSDGFITIHGNAFVNSNDAAEVIYTLTPGLDGVKLKDSMATYQASVNGAGAGELFTLSYSMTVPIQAGVHTLNQYLGPFSGTANFFYNRQYLSVLFVPELQGSYSTSGAMLNQMADSVPTMNANGAYE